MTSNSNRDTHDYSPNTINYQSHIPAAREIVTVFWDYENCPCPMSTKIATLTYDIKRRIDHFLGKKLNKRIQLYCPMQRLHTRTRENATDLGILMMDVASKRKQESVDKRIIADIGLFAAELAESHGNDIGHIVLVSGDSDYGYILARLRDKSYIGKIIIFMNDYTKETLIQHADMTHCLFQSNLTRKENPFSDYNQRKIPSSHKISPYNFSYNHTNNQNNYANPNNNTYANNANNSYSNLPPTQWTTTYNFSSYQNGDMHNTPDLYSNGHRSAKSESKSYHNLHNASTKSKYSQNNHTKGKNKRANNQSRSPQSHPQQRYTQNNVKILKKPNRDNNTDTQTNNSVSKPNSKKGDNNNNGTYVYRKKENNKSPHRNGSNGNAHISHIQSRDNKDKDNILSLPAPIPPKPSSISPESSHSKSSPHRIVSQENLEQQLKQEQHTQKQQKQKQKQQKQKQKKQRQKHKQKRRSNTKLSSSTDLTKYTNSAAIDGVCKKDNESTFSVGQLYKATQINGDSTHSALEPNKLDFDTVNERKSNVKDLKMDNDFFNSMITPNQDEMDQLLKDIAPKVNVLTQNNGQTLVFPPKTSHIIDLKQIRLRDSTAPKKILLKKQSTTNGSANGSGNKSMAISDKIRLVWTALNYCQQNSNNTPRRREIYKAMKKTHSEYMVNRDQSFADECIDTCLSYGTVEEMIKGRISSLYILPVILNALTSDDCVFYLKSDRDKGHVWITLLALKKHLKSRHTNHLSTYFTLTYLYRIISNATRLFAFHKEDKHKGSQELGDAQLGVIQFRVRKNAFNNSKPQTFHKNDYAFNNFYS